MCQKIIYTLLICLVLGAMPAYALAREVSVSGYSCTYKENNIMNTDRFDLTLKKDGKSRQWYCKFKEEVFAGRKYNCWGTSTYDFMWGHFGPLEGVCQAFVKLIEKKKL